jgi:hypothetical protein
MQTESEIAEDEKTEQSEAPERNLSEYMSELLPSPPLRKRKKTEDQRLEKAF